VTGEAPLAAVPIAAVPIAAVPIAEGLFTGPDDAPRLIGGRCTACGAASFPRARGCARCGSDEVASAELPRTGTLWTWTTQGFRPKAPYAGPGTDEDFEPFPIGYVELVGEAGPELRVEGHLVGVEPDAVRIGMPMEVVVVPFTTRADGTAVRSYAFAPAVRT
jgi:uncharacterized OB-fold protein